MGNIKSTSIYKECMKAYEKSGVDGVNTVANNHNLEYGFCAPCDCEAPKIPFDDISICAICGQEINPS